MTEEHSETRAQVGHVLPAEYAADDKPFELAAQRKLFKAGVMGHAVEIWTSSTGVFSYPPTALEAEPGQPIIVAVDSEDIDDQISFAAAYATGWVESQGGSLQDMRIWLVPHLER